MLRSQFDFPFLCDIIYIKQSTGGYHALQKNYQRSSYHSYNHRHLFSPYASLPLCRQLAGLRAVLRGLSGIYTARLTSHRRCRFLGDLRRGSSDRYWHFVLSHLRRRNSLALGGGIRCSARQEEWRDRSLIRGRRPDLEIRPRLSWTETSQSLSSLSLRGKTF